MVIKIGESIEQLKEWFSAGQVKIKAQAADIEAKLTKQNTSPLPAETIAGLKSKIDDLPPHPTHIAALQSKLTEALAQWQSDRDAPNSLVVLASPVEPIEAILKETLAAPKEKIPQVKSLLYSARSPDGSKIQAKLSEQLELSQTSQFQEKVLIAIPNLSWCFLRCVEGLEGIEYLQDLVLNDREQFWLIGCNNWTWKYLDRVCNLSTYLEQTLSLPTLNDIELKEWLLRVSETIDFDFADDRDSQKDASRVKADNEENWTSQSEQRYYNHLADISLGMSRVAARLWLKSLCVLELEEESTNSDTASKSFILQRVTLPELPTLTKDDRFLLYSMSLHGNMTLSELALSLGERESNVRAQIQLLWRSGVIERQQESIELNPSYYPRVRTNLENNQFLLGGL